MPGDSMTPSSAAVDDACTESLGPADRAAPLGSIHRFFRGCRLGLPVFLGYLPVGAAFGVIARSVGFTSAEAVLCSATALAGAGQFISLSLLAAGADVLSILAANAVVNLRYVLFAATLSPHLTSAPMHRLPWLGFTLTDETFAINIADIRQGGATLASMGGVGAVSWTGWVAGTLLGATAAGWIGDPSRFGVDFAMPAMFAALFIALAENGRHVAVGLGAAAIGLLLPVLSIVDLTLPASWHVVIASIVAATVATVVVRDE